MDVTKYYGRNVITDEVYRFSGSCLYKLKTSDSWRGRKDISCTYTKEEKEALNTILFFILLSIREKDEGKLVNWNACIAYVIKRITRKALTWDAKPENMDDMRRRVPDYDEKVEEYVRLHFYSETSDEYVDFIDVLASQISEEEKELFSVAKNHTNLVEFEQIKNVIFEEDREKIEKRLKADAARHKTWSYVSKELNALISRISWARNIVRWQGYGSPLPCNILCHMLETAVFAWLMAIEENIMYKCDKRCPEQAFRVGLYHDLSEIWTDDIPSPCKDEIGRSHGSNIRAVTEEQEKEALEKYFYVIFSPAVATFFKTEVMLDELEDADFHTFMKKADYFSADYEVYWNIVYGLRHYRFHEILQASADVNRRTPAIVKLIKGWLESLENVVFLKP